MTKIYVTALPNGRIEVRRQVQTPTGIVSKRVVTANLPEGGTPADVVRNAMTKLDVAVKDAVQGSVSVPGSE